MRGGARVNIDSAEPRSSGDDVREPAASPESALRLFEPRLSEFGETRTNTVVATEPVVREELVVGRNVEHRTERVEATLRRTEVDVERLTPASGDEEGA